MNMLFLVAFGTAFATLCGGFLALRWSDKLHLIAGFSAGAVLGVVFFDLLPEALLLTKDAFEISTLASFIAVGFVLFMVADRLLVAHPHDRELCQNANHRGALGAGSLSFHSFLDGLAVGLSFQVSVAVGLVVTLAVLTHDFSDGINTVTLILKNGGTRRKALRWLSVDAAAPVFGIAASFFVSVSEVSLGVLLALFCGFFFYLGASDLLPESHHAHPTLWTTAMTVFGMATLFVAVRLAGI